MNEIEKQIKKYWDDNKLFDPLFKTDKQKYFITVHYPNIDESFDLNDAFNVLCADFIARYQRLLNKNVLFLCNNKYEINNLKKLGISIYYNEMLIDNKNPFYDSFVKWQFNKLKNEWFTNYKENEWKNIIVGLFNNIDIDEKYKKNIINNLDQFKEWIMTKTLNYNFISPSYYSFCHLLFQNALNINVNEITDEVWEYIFCDGQKPIFSNDSLLENIKLKFNQWYPIDCVISSKKILKNYLIIYLYNNAIVLNDEKWLHNIYINENVKLPKNNDDFVTFNDAIKLYSIDSIRLTFAESNRNFNHYLCKRNNDLLLEYIDWVNDIINMNDDQSIENKLFDDIFINGMNKIIRLVEESYSTMKYHNIIKFGWYEFQQIKKDYLYRTRGSINKKIFVDFIKKHLIMMSPIIPHTCEYLWNKLENKSVMNQQFPLYGDYNKELVWLEYYYKKSIHEFRKSWMHECKRARKKNKIIKKAYIIVYNEWLPLQIKTIDSLKEVYLKNKRIPSKIVHHLKPYFGRNEWKQGVMKTFRYIRDNFNKRGQNAFTYEIPINEKDIMIDNIDKIKNMFKLDELYVIGNRENLGEMRKKYQDKLKKLMPEKPVILFILE